MGFKDKKSPEEEKEAQLQRYKDEIAKYEGKEEFQPLFDNYFSKKANIKKIGHGNQGVVYKVKLY